MSFVDLATLALHRRNEMEARINVFSSKCDRAINDIKKLKMLAQGFTEHLNCEPGELKERFLNCMKQLDEYTYLITDFNLAINKLEANNGMELAPVHDTSVRALPIPASCGPLNLMDVLTEPTPSTSKTCPNQCATEVPIKKKAQKTDQILIAFSSTSNSSESIIQTKNDNTSEKEVQCKLADNTSTLNKDNVHQNVFDNYNLPAQTILQTDQRYPATILNVDGISLWVTTEDPGEVHDLIMEMTEFYRNYFVELSMEDVTSLTCCACYDDESDCYYRCLFIRLIEEEEMLVEVFLVDTGAFQIIPIVNIQPLAKQFSTTPPYVRCCHLAGVDLFTSNKDRSKKLEEFLKRYIGMPCTIEVDDNTSESLGVFVTLDNSSNRQVLNMLLVEQGLAQAIERVELTDDKATHKSTKGPPEMLELEINITDCPEYDDPVEAVTGYHNRDEADICKHYKGGPEKTCFKGTRCTKRHILKHPDGWTMDRVPVAGKCRPLPLPAPRTWLRVYVSHVAHYDRLYVQIVQPHKEEQVPSFGVVLPPTTLERLVKDMNSPAALMSIKPLKMAPAPGELVAAFYSQDNQWYRARVLSSTRVDQNVEVMYIDYGNVVWVKEDSVRELEKRYWSLEAQAILCKLAGVKAKSSCSGQWAAAKGLLQRLVQEGTACNAHVVARGYDEITIELFDEKGRNLAEQMAASKLIELTEYTVEDDSGVRQKIVPA